MQVIIMMTYVCLIVTNSLGQAPPIKTSKQETSATVMSPVTKTSPSKSLPTTNPSTTKHPTSIPSFQPTIFIPTFRPTILPTLSFRPTLIPTPFVSTTTFPTPNPIQNGVTYTGGAVLTSPTVYLIWYGNWLSNGNDPTVTAVELFINSLSNTPYEAILTLYYMIDPITNAKTNIGTEIAFGGSVFDHYSAGFNITRNDMNNIIANMRQSGVLSSNPQGSYLFLASGDVLMPSFCNGACGYHSGNGISPISFIGFTSQCPNGCAPTSIFGNSVNGQLLDGFINVISHELFVTIIGSWSPIDSRCQWTFGNVMNFTNAQGQNKTYNLELGSQKYLVQREWINANGGYCALSYP